MAKPGTPEAHDLAQLAQMSKLAHDIGRGRIPDVVKGQLLVQMERQLGVRCGGCDQRIRVGFKFHRLDVAVENGEPQALVTVLSACNREDCDFAEKAREGATYVEMIEFAWMVQKPDEKAEAA